jgi:hypothetical protein
VYWIVPVLGIGFISATLPMGSLVALNYVIDCYKEAASEAIVAVILIRNTMGKPPFLSLFQQVPISSDIAQSYVANEN